MHAPQPRAIVSGLESRQSKGGWQMALLDLQVVTVRGTPRQMGLAHGQALADTIRRFVPMRFDATREYLATLGHSNIDPLLDVARQALALYARWHPEGHDEHVGIADGAGVDPVELYAAANMTDLRDVLALSGPVADAEGCSALLLPASYTQSGQIVAAQTWDLNPQDLDYVVGIRREPTSGPSTFSVTCSGCLTLVGVSSNGLAVGTTNLKTQGSHVGLGYMSVLHKMLTAPDFATAAAICETAPRAAAHTYWLADATQAAEWETTGFSAVRRDATERYLARTNHCQVAAHSKVEGEAPSASSTARLARLHQLLDAQRDHNLASIQAIFADRADGVNSINRFAEDGQGTATNSCFVCWPAQKLAWVCRGSADRGQWQAVQL